MWLHFLGHQAVSIELAPHNLWVLYLVNSTKQTGEGGREYKCERLAQGITHTHTPLLSLYPEMHNKTEGGKEGYICMEHEHAFVLLDTINNPKILHRMMYIYYVQL